MDLFFTLGKAFLVGGIFCAVGQILIDKTKLTPARILVGYVVMGVLLSALGLYQPIVDFAGAGATVPLTGFGHLLATGVQKGSGGKGPFWRADRRTYRCRCRDYGGNDFWVAGSADF